MNKKEYAEKIVKKKGSEREETTCIKGIIAKDNVEFILEIEYGSQPLYEIFADYIADVIKEGGTLEYAA